jgi:hypothetical protein
MTSAEAARWDRSSNPDFFKPVAEKGIVHTFHDLPLKAELPDNRFGWSDSFWPSRRGGIAFRWNSPNPQPFTYKLKTRAEILTMSQSELSELSPAELYDISQSDYSFKLTRKVLREYSPKDLWWEGICHGWALAAGNYAEPDKTVVTNKEGIEVPFGSSDVKALISMHDAYNSKGFNVRVGERCKVPGKVAGEALEADGIVPIVSKRDAEKSECSDVNAGSFHIVLTSMIGINGHSFVAEVDRYNDVWNQPVVGYESQVAEELQLTDLDKSRGIDRKIRILTSMSYGDELEFYKPERAAEGYLGFVSKEPVTGTPAQQVTSRNYEYILELYRNGKIIGGEWISEGRPDFLWMKKKDVRFLNGKMPLSGLNSIYKPVKR